MRNNKKSTPKPLLHAENPLLYAARMERGWSQAYLAELIGTTCTAISRWEHGVTFPIPYFRQRMGEVFGKTMAELGLLPPSDGARGDEGSGIVLPEPGMPPPSNDTRIVSIPHTHNPFFTGREPLLTSLHERLSTARSAALTQAQALFGLGGIGKTQTATEYVFRYGDEYSHVFWIRADTRESLITGFVDLAQQLDLPEKEGQEQARIVAAVKRWLNAHPGWLLILDNADDLPLTQEFLPTVHKGYILFTTRAQAAGKIAVSIEVDKLDLQDSILLLLRQSKRLVGDASLDSVLAEDRSAAEHIAKELDGLPLALAQAGAYVEETGCSLTDYINRYATHRKILLARRSRLLQDYPETVDTTWSLSFQQVEQHNLAAAMLLRLSAFLAPDALPEELLLRGASQLDAATRDAVTDLFMLDETMEVLRRYSLIRRNSSIHVLSVHRLVQTVIKENMDQEARRAWAERTVRVVNAAFPVDDDSTSTDHEYFLQYFLPHVQVCATLIEEYQLYFSEAALLLHQAGVFLYKYGFYPQSEAFLQQALTIRIQVFGHDHEANAKSLNYLAMLSRIFGKYEQAESFHLQALAIRETIFGPNHLTTSESLNNLGVLYRNQGKYEQAEPLLQQALNIRAQVLGSDHPETLNTSINIAKLYLEQRKYEHAEQLLKQSLTAFQRIPAPGHPNMAQNLNLLARLANEQGQYEQAEDFWQQAIEIVENMLGRDHPALAEYLDSLAELFFVQGRYAQAQSHCQRALCIYENTFGAEHPDTISYRQHLSRIMSK